MSSNTPVSSATDINEDETTHEAPVSTPSYEEEEGEPQAEEQPQETPALPTPSPEGLWGRLQRIPVEPRSLERNLVISAKRQNPAHAAFDVLRTRVIRAMSEQGWSRIGITSPTAGCGKSFTALNLAISLSRLKSFHSLLIDLDLRQPSLADMLGLKNMPAMGDFLRGEISSEDFFASFSDNAFSIGDRLALGVNGQAEPYAAELLHHHETTRILSQAQADFGAHLVLYDLPPALAHDDVLAIAPNLDCILLVVSGSETRAREVREVERRLNDTLPILGVVLNKAEEDETPGYAYQ